MSDFGWRRGKSVREWFREEPWAFEFFQAVRLLEAENPLAVSPGEGDDPSRELVRFRSHVGLDFPASDISLFEPSSDAAHPPEMTVNFMGLAGLSGPLTRPDTEMVLERLKYKDTAFRDFLDIFNHRLISLMVRIKKAHNPSLTTKRADKTPVANFLYSFFGMGLEQLRHRLQIPDRTLLFYAGLLSQRPRSAAALERVLSDYFRVPASVKQMVGQWRTLESNQWTTLGATGRNQVLGQSVLLGTRVWDQQARFEIRFGPMTFTSFAGFLPGGAAFESACELARFFGGPEFTFSFRLVLASGYVPEASLGSARLGWTSWMKTKPVTHDDSQVQLRAYPNS